NGADYTSFFWDSNAGLVLHGQPIAQRALRLLDCLISGCARDAKTRGIDRGSQICTIPEAAQEDTMCLIRGHIRTLFTSIEPRPPFLQSRVSVPHLLPLLALALQRARSGCGRISDGAFPRFHR